MTEEQKEHKRKIKANSNKNYYNNHKEKEIARVRQWEKENQEKRKEYTKKYYQSERGKMMRAGQIKRRIEKMNKLKEEIQKLNNLIKNFENWLIEKNSETNQEVYLQIKEKLNELKRELENEEQQ